MTPFEALVRDMRKAQKEYFKSRTPFALNESKRLERLVDLELEKLRKAKQQNGENLFEE